jgi:type I restriction enzyme R subunit
LESPWFSFARHRRLEFNPAAEGGVVGKPALQGFGPVEGKDAPRPRRRVGVVAKQEKPDGTTLSGFSGQAARYMAEAPAHLVKVEGQVRFEYVASGFASITPHSLRPANRA